LNQRRVTEELGIGTLVGPKKTLVNAVFVKL
jgi:hypothetical protein